VGRVGGAFVEFGDALEVVGQVGRFVPADSFCTGKAQGAAVGVAGVFVE